MESNKFYKFYTYITIITNWNALKLWMENIEFLDITYTTKHVGAKKLLFFFWLRKLRVYYNVAFLYKNNPWQKKIKNRL